MFASRGRVIAATLALVMAVAAGAFIAGRSVAQRANWHSGTAYLLGYPDSPGFSARIEGWTYGAEGTVPHWIDARGTIHEDEWPSCLLPPGIRSTRDRRVPVRFAETTVWSHDAGSRIVGMVDCRS